MVCVSLAFHDEAVQMMQISTTGHEDATMLATANRTHVKAMPQMAHMPPAWIGCSQSAISATLLLYPGGFLSKLSAMVVLGVLDG